MKKISLALLGLFFGFWCVCPVGAVVLREGEFLEKGFALPLEREPQMAWDDEILILKFSFLPEMKYMSVRLQEDGKEVEEVRYEGNEKFSRIVGFQQRIRLDSADGKVFLFAYRKENFHPEKKNLLVFIVGWSASLDPMCFCYQVVKNGEEFDFIPVDL